MKIIKLAAVSFILLSSYGLSTVSTFNRNQEEAIVRTVQYDDFPNEFILKKEFESYDVVYDLTANLTATFNDWAIFNAFHTRWNFNALVNLVGARTIEIKL